MRTIKIGEKTSFQIKNANILGFFIMIYAVAHTDNEDPVLVPDKLKINAKLRQAGFNGDILDGLVRSLWRGTQKRRDYAGNAAYMSTRVVTAKGASDDGILEYHYKILFPTTIQMNGSDEMEVTLEFPSDALTNHDTSLSYVGIREIYGTGSQYFIPKVIEHTLPALETRYEKYLGDNVLRTVVMGSGTNTVVADGLTNVEYTSDRKNDLLDVQELTYEGLANGTAAVIVTEEELDNMKIKCTMDGSNNAAGDLKLVVTSYYIDSTLVNTGKRREAKHEAKLNAKAQA